MQEAAAAAFLRGSRANGRSRSLGKMLMLQAFPPVHAMADTGRKCAAGTSGVKPKATPAVRILIRAV